MKELDFAILFVRGFLKTLPKALPMASHEMMFDRAHAHYAAHGLTFDSQRRELIADVSEIICMKSPVLVERFEFNGWRREFLEATCRV